MTEDSRRGPIFANVDTHLPEDDLTHAIIGAFYTVYNTLGFGFLEHVYARALAHELRKRHIGVAREVWIDVHYDGEKIAKHRLDMVVDERVVVEIKSTTLLSRSVARQCLNYMRATDLEIGLVLHFGPRADFYRMNYRRCR